ncbi:TonB-dependent receptor [Sphingobium sp.]|uniref:TonB-dependent receptor n=1 Tax=Sphingobium sp. TaxID=1912891 RepID=UPI003B3A5DE4
MPTNADIVVTAERRETRLQETPVAVSVIGGEALQGKQINSALDIGAALPAVQIGEGLGQLRISVRGVSFTDLRAGAEGRIAFYVNGVYNGQPSAQTGSFFDVERVELLRGPQGTLFGRNATGGAFNITTRMPTRDVSGYVNMTAGNYKTMNVEAALSGPLTDTLTARIAAKTVNHGGYGRNLYTGTSINNAHTQSFRATLHWEPSDKLDMVLIANYHNEDDRNFMPSQFGQVLPVTTLMELPPRCTPETYQAPNCILSFSRDTTSRYNNTNERWQKGVNLTTSYDLNDWLTLKSVLAASFSYYKLTQGNSGSPGISPYNTFFSHNDQYTAEFQLLGDRGPLSFVLGAFYFNDKTTPRSITALPSGAFVPNVPNYLAQGSHSMATLLTRSVALYGQATYEVTDQLSLTLGGRYTSEKKHNHDNYLGFNVVTPYPAPGVTGGFILNPPNPGFPNNQHISVSAFNPKVTIDYKFTPDIFGYATYSRGFKSGGFNWGQTNPPYPEENIDNYEVGLKTTFFGGGLTANLAAFYYDYSNIQTQVVGTGPGVSGVLTQSAGAATIKGVELEFGARPTRNLRFDGSVALLDAKFKGDLTTVDNDRPQLGPLRLAGNWIQGAPRYTVNIGGEYEADLGNGSLTLRGEYRRTGKVDWSIFNLPGLRTPSYGVGNIFLTYANEDDRWSAGLFMRNVSNRLVATTLFKQANALGAMASGSALEPRTYGVTLGYKF